MISEQAVAFLGNSRKKFGREKGRHNAISKLREQCAGPTVI